LETAKFFSNLGKDIVFIKPSSIPNTHTPDIIMEGVEWEMKTPTGNGRRTIDKCFRIAVKQSKYIIIDLRKIQLSDKQCLAQIEKEFITRKYLKRIYVITKKEELVRFPNNN